MEAGEAGYQRSRSASAAPNRADNSKGYRQSIGLIPRCQASRKGRAVASKIRACLGPPPARALPSPAPEDPAEGAALQPGAVLAARARLPLSPADRGECVTRV